METDTFIAALQREMDWLELAAAQAIRTYLLQDGHEQSWQDLPLPVLDEEKSPFGAAVTGWELNIYERLALALALAPHLRPEALDIFFGKNQLYDRAFTEFGGVTDKSHSGFLPTGQTLCFIITACDRALLPEALRIFSQQSILTREQVLTLSEAEPYLPKHSGVLSISSRWLHHFLTGEEFRFDHSPSFPAQKITSQLDWADLVLDPQAGEHLSEINTWLEHGETLMKEWGLQTKLKPGYRALFYGPPGTGKTLAATLIGKNFGKDVYRVDLSMTVSKYIGETEKNLAKIFDAAADKNWILFFDEADALFGKRTAASSSNDRHANQQTGYLLQRIEDFPGVTILATNLQANLDEAFSRRFQAIVHFKMPSPHERYRLWQQAFTGACTLHPDIDLYQIAELYEIAGGAIINVLRYCALSAIKRKSTIVTREELIAGIRREFKKENKTIGIIAG